MCREAFNGFYKYASEKTPFFKRDKYINSFDDVKTRLIIGNINIKNPPLVSIVIPTYKRTELLKQAIDSCLNQVGFDNYEIIIIDNEDEYDCVSETEKIIKLYNNPKILYYRNDKNLGMCGNHNRGLSLCRGKWVVFLHSDDMLKPNHLKETMCILRNNKNKNITVLYVGHENLFEIDKKVNNKTELELKKTLKLIIKQFFIKDDKRRIYVFNPRGYLYAVGISCHLSGTVFNRKNLLQFGGFDINLEAFDLNFMLGYSLYNKIYYTNNNLSIIRFNNNLTLLKGVRLHTANYHYYLMKALSNKLRCGIPLINDWWIDCKIKSYISSANRSDINDIFDATDEDLNKCREIVRINKSHKFSFKYIFKPIHYISRRYWQLRQY